MIRVTFSPFTAEPRYVQSLADAVLETQMQFAMATWEAQIRFVQSLGMAAIMAQWSLLERMHQAHTRTG